MSRAKIHATAADKQAQYRRRRAKVLEVAGPVLHRLAELENAHWHAPGGAGGRPTSVEAWYAVSIKVDRPEMPAPAYIRWTMSGEELALLRADLKRFAQQECTQPDATAYYGTYAFVDTRGPSSMPGMGTLAFDGLMLEEALPLPGFEPPSQYTISRGAADLLRSRQRPLVFCP